MTRYVFALVVMTYLLGFVLTAPTSDYEYDYGKRWDDTNTSPKPVTTTTPTPLRPELQCENTYENFNVSANNLVKEDIQKLMGEYNNWGKLLAPAPVVIGILGQLILMANQINDFPLTAAIHVKYLNTSNISRASEQLYYKSVREATRHVYWRIETWTQSGYTMIGYFFSVIFLMQLSIKYTKFSFSIQLETAVKNGGNCF